VTSRSERPRFRVRRELVSLLAYLAVTVAFPALSGATRLEGFGEHAAITLGVSGAFAGAWLGGRAWTERRRAGPTTLPSRAGHGSLRAPHAHPTFALGRCSAMPDSAVLDERGLRPALAKLESILVKDEVVEAWAAQRRWFALTHRRLIVAATNNRLIALRRGLIGGFEYSDLRWQDLKEAHVSVGILGATLRLLTESSSDLASAQSPNRNLAYAGLDPDQAQAVYRICQAQDQAWREKRRIREMEELRARSGGVQIMGGPAGALGGASGDAMQRLEQARQMLAAKVISDAEYEAIKARVLGGP
jgi:PH (Pleckstrin Homology) domain-containing protein